MAVEYRGIASTKVEEGKRYFEGRHWSESVSSFQEAIELFTKAAFLYLGVQPPRKHKISAEEFVRLQIHLPKDLEKIRLAKVYLVSLLWSQVYLLAKYGNEVLKVGPSEFFDREEGNTRNGPRQLGGCIFRRGGMENRHPMRPTRIQPRKIVPAASLN
ncbi:HEPN domain-containing protein [Candidatus Bathyarchaeota archaeon]|nr:MAG: HEPN domain-containing protein [Candidatus Bathyarchaeota archaeon]